MGLQRRAVTVSLFCMLGLQQPAIKLFQEKLVVEWEDHLRTDKILLRGQRKAAMNRMGLTLLLLLLLV